MCGLKFGLFKLSMMAVPLPLIGAALFIGALILVAVLGN
jgi:hypothetical protein